MYDDSVSDGAALGVIINSEPSSTSLVSGGETRGLDEAYTGMFFGDGRV